MSSRAYLNIQDYRKPETIAPIHIQLTKCVSKKVQTKLWDFGPCPTVLEIKKSRFEEKWEQMRATIQTLRTCFDIILYHLHIKQESSSESETRQLVSDACISPDILKQAQSYSDQLVRAERQIEQNQ